MSLSLILSKFTKGDNQNYDNNKIDTEIKLIKWFIMKFCQCLEYLQCWVNIFVIFIHYNIWLKYRQQKRYLTPIILFKDIVNGCF